MEFIYKKCKVMHLGYNILGHVYTMSNQELSVTEEERDIGVCVSKTLKPSAQCAQAAKTAHFLIKN
jgi:hypothetical protein